MNALEIDIQSEAEREELAWLAALREQNTSALEALLHDEFTSTSARSSGGVIRKADYVSSAPQLKICDYELRDISIRHIRDVAIVKARLICDSKYEELDIHDDLLITDVWIRLEDRWLALTRHASQLPK